MNKRIFVKNTALITLTSLLLRGCGILFRIILSRLVGAEGMGLYQLVFSVYILGGAFAAGGLTVAVTRLAGEQLARHRPREVRRLMRAAGLSCLVVGGGTALLLLWGAPLLGRLMGDSRAADSIALCGFFLPFSGFYCCLRGYFTARRQALPGCLSQLAEQAVRIAVILALLYTVWDGRLQTACCILVLGDGLAECAGCLWLWIAYLADRKTACPAAPADRVKGLSLWRPLWAIALPLTAGRCLSAALRTAENSLVPARLCLYNHSLSLSLAQFGAVKGMALPLIFFPSALLMTVSGLLVPELSDARALHQQRQVSLLVERTLHTTLLSAAAIGGLFTLLGKALGTVLYNDPAVGSILQILGPLTPVMYADSAAQGMLRGLGQQVHTLGYAAADSLLRIGLIWVLLPRYGLAGFLFVMLVSNLLTAGLSLHRLLAVSGASIPWRRWLLRPAAIALLIGGGLTYAAGRFPLPGGLWDILLGGTAFLVGYGAMLPLCRCVSAEELAMLFRKRA